MKKYSCNSLLQWHNDDKVWLERVLSVDPITENVLCVRIEPQNPDLSSWPFLRSKAALDEAIVADQARALERDPFLRPPVDPNKLSKEMKARWERNWKAIEDIVGDPRKMVNHRKRRGQISKAARENGVNRRTVYRLLWKYWKGGQTPQCVLPDYRECGGKTRKFKGGKKRGRRSAREAEENKRIGLVITDKLKARILRGLKRHYNSEKGLTLEQAYDLMLKDEFCDGGELKNGVWVPTLKGEDEIPSLRQVKYIFYQARDPETETTSRQGENTFALTGRAITGNSETEVSGPGAIGQMDATTADIYLRSEHDPDLIVGRPIIYAIKDVWGRFLYAIVATFERPSYWGAAIALENALIDKVVYCAQYGITIREDEWPVDFLPSQLMVDRGEMSTYKTDHLVTGLGIRIATLPPRRGDLKGIVEQHFRLINNQMISWLPGALPRFRKDRKERRELDAVLTISEFRRLLIQATLTYHRSLLKGYKLAEDMIAAGIERRPIELLHWGIQNRDGLFRKFPINQARFHLLPHAEAQVTEKGVRFNGLFYTCDRAVREKWFEAARKYGTSPKEIAFDPRGVDAIYFQPRTSTEIEEMVLTMPDRRFSGWTWDEVEDHSKKMRVAELSSRHKQRQERLALQAAREQISKNAQARQDAAAASNPDQSKAAQVGKIPQNREAEKAAERAESLQTNTTPEPNVLPIGAPQNIIPLNTAKEATPPVESEFDRRLREKLNRHKGKS
jgi:putative transposase